MAIDSFFAPLFDFAVHEPDYASHSDYNNKKKAYGPRECIVNDCSWYAQIHFFFFVHFFPSNVCASLFLSHKLYISFYQLHAQHKIAGDLNFSFIYHLSSNNLLVSILPIWWIDTIENWRKKINEGDEEQQKKKYTDPNSKYAWPQIEFCLELLEVLVVGCW